MSGLLKTLSAAILALGMLWLGVAGSGSKLFVWLLAFAAFGVAAALCLVVPVKGRPALDKLGILAFLAAFAYLVVRAILSPIPYYALMDGVLVAACFLVFAIFASGLTDTKHRKVFVFTLYALLVGNLLVALHQLVGDPSFHILPGETRTNRREGLTPSGFYHTHDHMAFFCEAVAMFALSFAVYGRGRAEWRIVHGFVVLLALAGVAVSSSRGALLALSCGLGAFALIGLYRGWHVNPLHRKKIVIGYLAAFFVVAGLLGAISIAQISKRFESGGGDGPGLDTLVESGLDVRKTNWMLALEQWSMAPVFGNGARTYNELSVRDWPEGAPRVESVGHPIHAHNDYVQILAEYGAVGFVLVVGVIAMAFFRGGVYILKREKARFSGKGKIASDHVALYTGAVCCLVAACVHSILDFNIHLLINALPVAFALAVLLSPGLKKRGNLTGSEKMVVWSLRGVACLFAAGAVWLAVRVSRPEFHYEAMMRAMNAEDLPRALQHGLNGADLGTVNHVHHRVFGYARRFYAEEFDIPPLKKTFMQKAVESFESAVALNERDIFAQVGLGLCLDDLGEKERAEAAYTKALEWGPFESNTTGHYGYHLLDRAQEAFLEGKEESGLQLTGRAMEVFETGFKATSSREGLAYTGHAEAKETLFAYFSDRGFEAKLRGEAMEAAGDRQGAEAEYAKAVAYFDRAVAQHTHMSVANHEERMARHEIEKRIASWK